MSLTRSVLDINNGETLSPSRLNRGFERMYRDFSQSVDKRYNRFQFALDFSGLATGATAEEAIFRIKPPFAWAVEFVELFVYEATAITSVSLSSSLAGFKTVTATPAGATTRAAASMAMEAAGVAGIEQTFTMTIAGAGTLDRCIAIVHCRGDRGDAGLTYTRLGVADAPRFAAGEAVLAAKLNTAFTAYQSAVTKNTLANRDLRIIVFPLRNMAVALAVSDRDIRIPGTTTRFHTMDVVNLGGVGDNVTAIIGRGTRNATTGALGTTVTSVTVNGSGTPPAKTQGTSVAHTQVTNDPADPTDDYYVQFSRAGASIIPLAYVVVYCS